jgi:tRNA(Ile)-lysidine synthase
VSRHGVVAVAASGGRDSTALLHATARAARDAGLQVQVLALHVHHGLMPAADSWWQHVAQQCARWHRAGLPVGFMGTRLSGQPAPAESVEAWARRERYKALGNMARAGGAEVVLLAHHQRDQAETFFLQALRGAGPKGLAAMPASVQRDGLLWCRPWLDQPAESIDAYVRRHRLSFVHDASNADPRFARSRLRTRVWPALMAAFDGVEPALTAAARRAQESAEALAELAALDMAGCCDIPGDGQPKPLGALAAKPWATLSPARRSNVLRHWLHQAGARAVPESLIERLLQEWPLAGAGHRWPAPGGWVHSGRDGLFWLEAESSLPTSTAERVSKLDLSVPGLWSAEGWGGYWAVRATRGAGIDARLLKRVELRQRAGAEQFQFDERSQPRSLKKQFQSVGVPAALRAGPLAYSGARLLHVPGLGTDARVLGRSGAARRLIDWVPGALPRPTV